MTMVMIVIGICHRNTVRNIIKMNMVQGMQTVIGMVDILEMSHVIPIHEIPIHEIPIIAIMGEEETTIHHLDHLEGMMDIEGMNGIDMIVMIGIVMIEIVMTISMEIGTIISMEIVMIITVEEVVDIVVVIIHIEIVTAIIPITEDMVDIEIEEEVGVVVDIVGRDRIIPIDIVEVIMDEAETVTVIVSNRETNRILKTKTNRYCLL